MQKYENLKELELFYLIEHNDKNGNVHSFNLIKNENEIKIKSIEDYIKKRIEFMNNLKVL